jgi:hypothetical protein
MTSVLVYNGCGSETINYTILIPGSDPLPGQVPPAPGINSVPVPIPSGATAIGFIGFSGDSYIAAPGTNIGANEMEMAGVDGGGTPPTLGAPQNAAGSALVFDASSAAATWIVQTTDIGPMNGPVAAGTGAPIPLDSDVTWVGFTGVNGDVYTSLPGYAPTGYQACLVLCKASTPVADVHEAFRKAAGG